jgi:hypothetical protein
VGVFLYRFFVSVHAGLADHRGGPSLGPTWPPDHEETKESKD